MKRILAFLISAALVMTSFSGMTVSAADTTTEVESNNTLASGTLVTNGVACVGELSSTADVDCYKFNIAENGYFSVSFSVDKLVYDSSQIGEGWLVELYDSEGELLYSKETKETFTTPEYGFKPGTYYIKVVTPSDFGFCTYPINVQYSVKANFTKTEYWEKEYNNTKGVADLISLGQDYYGTMYSKSEADFYKFTVNEAGYFKVNLNVDKTKYTADKIGEGWILKVYDTEGAEIYSADVEKSSATPIFPFEKGTFYISVTTTNYSFGTYPVNIQYSVRVDFTKTEYWEKEYNNTKETADAISLGQTYNGTMYSKSEADFYKFTIKDTGYFKVNMSVDGTIYNEDEIGEGWILKIFDASGAEIYSTTVVNSCITQALPFVKGTYYISVTTTNYSFGTYPINIPYSIKVDFTKTDSWESENNVTLKTADPIAVNKTYKGNLYDKNDVDYYKFVLTNKSKVKVQFSVDGKVYKKEQINDGWILEVYDTKNKVVAEILNITKSTSKTVTLKKGTYYVKVKGVTGFWKTPATYVDYSIKASVSVAPTKVKVASKGKKELKVTWESLDSGVTYYVYRKTSSKGKYTLVKTTTSKSFTDKKVSYGKKYYYRVIGKTKTLSGNYSSTVSATALSKAKIAKISKSSKGVVLKMSKVTGATKYTIYRATSKNGKYKKLATTKSTSYTDKTAKKGKTYYYKVKANGVNSGYGALSNPKAGKR